MDMEHPQAMAVAVPVSTPTATPPTPSPNLSRGAVTMTVTKASSDGSGSSPNSLTTRGNHSNSSIPQQQSNLNLQQYHKTSHCSDNSKQSSVMRNRNNNGSSSSYNSKELTAQYTLPSALKQVLHDVARSGSCLNLYWTKRQQWQFQNSQNNTSPASNKSLSSTYYINMYPCLKDAMREALGYVLDAAYERAGYIDTAVTRMSNNSTSSARTQRSRYSQGHQQSLQQQQKQLTTSAFCSQNKSTFLDRRKRLLAMLPHDDFEATNYTGVDGSSEISEDKQTEISNCRREPVSGSNSNYNGLDGDVNDSKQLSSQDPLAFAENTIPIVSGGILLACNKNIKGDSSEDRTSDEMSRECSTAGSNVGTSTVVVGDTVEETSSASSSVTIQVHNIPQHLKGASNHTNVSSESSTITSPARSGYSITSTKTSHSGQYLSLSPPTSEEDGSPFTIQRIAEVLIAPEFYYTQTHKLCNGLEKLLLVTSSVTAFGGGGLDDGVVSTSEREMAALADEKGRKQQRKFKRKLSGTSEKSLSNQGSGNKDFISAQQQRVHQIRKRQEHMRHQTERLQMAEAMEPAHPSSPPHPRGIDGSNGNGGTGSPPTSPHSPVSVFNSVRRGSDDRDVAHFHGGDEDLADTGVIDHESFRAALRERYAISDDDRAATRAQSPPASPPTSPLMGGRRVKFGKISVPSGSEQSSMPNDDRTRNLSITRTPSPILYARSAPSMEQSNNSNERSQRAAHHLSPNILQHQQLDFDLDHSSAAHNPSNISGSTDVGDLEVEPSKSNSSISSDGSEDDDSLSSDRSDRSDGSESAYEPITAARVMALNRMQQQQRREQILQNRALAAARGTRFHPPPDSEYQSGDSVDSMKAYDSDGSESSSSV